MREIIKERALLQLIASGRATSQIHLSRALHAPRNTINGIVQEMLDSGRIESDTIERRRRGRPIQHYRLRQREPVLVLQWLASVWHAAVFAGGRLKGGVLTHQVGSIEGPEAALRVSKELAERALKSAKIRSSNLAGVVFALNAVKTRQGEFSSSVVNWVHQLSLPGLSLELGAPVEADLTHAAVSSELRARAGENVLSLAILNIGDGVSAHGESVNPEWGTCHAYAGELGHVVYDAQGPHCGCGHRGCLEAHMSGPAILKTIAARPAGASRASLLKAGEQSFQAMFDALEKLDASGDETARAIVAHFLDLAAWGVGATTNLVGPEVIVLSGYALQGRAVWRDRIQQLSRQYVLAHQYERLRIEFPRVTLEDNLRFLAHSHTFTKPPRE
jgi:predicted NBD/HSP70 family sugar kinase